MSFRDLDKFVKVHYLAYGGTGLGLNADAPQAIPTTSTALWAIPAGTIIEKMYLIIYTLITGTTNLDVGDDDDADGFIDGSLSVTLGTVGMYGWNAKTAGAYLRTETAGVTDPADVYVVPNAKYYTAAKSVKIVTSTANTAGKIAVVTEGYMATNPF
jgi:hypothetical protein